MTNRYSHQRLKDIVAQCAFPGLKFQFEEMRHGLGTTTFLRVQCVDGECNVTGAPMSWNGRWWRLSEHMTPTEVVLTAWKAILTALEHEAREQFTYKGVAVLDSHIDVEALVAARSQEKLDVRSPAR